MIRTIVENPALAVAIVAATVGLLVAIGHWLDLKKDRDSMASRLDFISAGKDDAEGFAGRLEAENEALRRRNAGLERLQKDCYSAENPTKIKPLDTWQAACGIARGRAEQLAAELAELKERYQCSACHGTGEIDETLGGENFSNPHAECPDCGGTGDLHNLPTVARRVTDADREKVRDAIAEALGGMIFCCTRQWSAWGYGTMSQNDFVLASEDDGILDDLTAAAVSAIEAKPKSGSAS